MKFLFRLYNYYLSPDRNFARRLRSLLGFTPANLSIFKLAFYHKSTSNEKLQSIQSNERLEYLGDAILGTIVAEYLFKKYPNGNEGFLTKMRSKIVKRNSLNKIADKMGLDVILAHYNNTRLSRSMLGNALEALVGAIYLECGYKGTRDYVIHKILRGYLDIHELESFDDNYKSQLLEWCQKNGQTVAYKMLAKYKYEKRDRFKVAVLIDGEKVATADDFNKKSAEQTASEKALRQLGIIEGDTANTKKSKSGGREKKPSSRQQSTQQRSSKKVNPASKKPNSTEKKAASDNKESTNKQPTTPAPASPKAKGNAKHSGAKPNTATSAPPKGKPNTRNSNSPKSKQEERRNGKMDTPASTEPVKKPTQRQNDLKDKVSEEKPKSTEKESNSIIPVPPATPTEPPGSVELPKVESEPFPDDMDEIIPVDIDIDFSEE